MYETLERLYPALTRHNNRFPLNWEFPLLKYVFYVCLQGSKSEDVALMQQALRFWESIESNDGNTFSFQDKSWLLFDRQHSQTHAPFEPKDNKEFVLFTEDNIKHGFQHLERDYLQQAWEAIEKTNFLPLVYESGGIIANHQERATSAEITAYTTKFEGVIYTDWSHDPIGYAESIVHEAAHSMLNYYIESLAITMPAGSYWSPWRQTERPTFGVLHGAWAFSHVYHYYDRLGRETGNPIYQTRAETEKQLLADVKTSLSKILTGIHSPVLDSLFAEIYPA
jgi:hypothetical protein